MMVLFAANWCRLNHLHVGQFDTNRHRGNISIETIWVIFSLAVFILMLSEVDWNIETILPGVLITIFATAILYGIGKLYARRTRIKLKCVDSKNPVVRGKEITYKSVILPSNTRSTVRFEITSRIGFESNCIHVLFCAYKKPFQSYVTSLSMGSELDYEDILVDAFRVQRQGDRFETWNRTGKNQFEPSKEANNLDLHVNSPRLLELDISPNSNMNDWKGIISLKLGGDVTVEDYKNKARGNIEISEISRALRRNMRKHTIAKIIESTTDMEVSH